MNFITAYRPFLLFLLFILSSSVPAVSQSLSYGIFKGEEQIGELKVERTSSGNKVQYKADSESHFRILFDNEYITETTALFVDQQLFYSMAKTTMNGKIREHSVTKKHGEGYNFYKHPDQKYQKKITPQKLSTLMLYYLEPRSIQQIFSENYQELCPIKALGNSTYELSLPGGKINHYLYKNGQLVEIKVFRTLIDLSFRLQEQS